MSKEEGSLERKKQIFTFWGTFFHYVGLILLFLLVSISSYFVTTWVYILYTPVVFLLGELLIPLGVVALLIVPAIAMIVLTLLSVIGIIFGNVLFFAWYTRKTRNIPDYSLLRIIKKCYFSVLIKSFVFRGRASREEFWEFVLFFFLFLNLGFIIDAFLKFFSGSFIVFPLYLLLTIPAFISITIRRIHDVNRSGWWILVPIYNLILVSLPGTKIEKKYDFDEKKKKSLT